MKGWKNDSYRHSLAARGVSTTKGPLKAQGRANVEIIENKNKVIDLQLWYIQTSKEAIKAIRRRNEDDMEKAIEIDDTSIEKAIEQFEKGKINMNVLFERTKDIKDGIDKTHDDIQESMVSLIERDEKFRNLVDTFLRDLDSEKQDEELKLKQKMDFELSKLEQRKKSGRLADFDRSRDRLQEKFDTSMERFAEAQEHDVSKWVKQMKKDFSDITKMARGRF